MESIVRSALTIPEVVDSDEHAAEVIDRLERQLSDWCADPPRIEDPASAFGNATFFLAYYGADVRPLHEKIATFYLRACPALNYTAPHAGGGPAQRRPLRVGFASRYFVNHTVSRLTSGLISKLPPDEFETILFRFPTRKTRLFDAVRLLKYPPHLREIESLAYPTAQRTVDLPRDVFAAREQIAAQELDVLVYPDIGMEPYTWFLAFARLAPVQCAMWGHPATTGIPAIDYFISADVVEPPGAEADYSERLVRLERLPAYYEQPPPATGESRDASGAPRVYACLQSPFKFLPAFDAVLAQLLEADPAGILQLLGDEDNERVIALRQRLARRLGGAIDRVRFLGMRERAPFLGLLRAADVLLDPFHFGSGNTAYEAMAAGTPVVTMPGRYMRGRIMAACYEQMGVKDLVVEDTDAYVQTVLALARDEEMREDKRAELLTRGDQLFEDRGAVEAFGEFLRRAAGAQ